MDWVVRASRGVLVCVFALAARPTRRGYDVPPGSATRASDLVRRGSVPDTIAPYRLAWKGARSNGVRANSRCDSGRRASPGSARVRRARRGVGHASVRVDAGDTRETRERRRAGREGRARVWVGMRARRRSDRDETLYVRPKYLTHFTVCSRLTIHTRAASDAQDPRLSWHEDSVFEFFFKSRRLKKAPAHLGTLHFLWRADAASPCWWTTPPARCARAATARSTCSTKTRTSCS